MLTLEYVVAFCSPCPHDFVRVFFAIKTAPALSQRQQKKKKGFEELIQQVERGGRLFFVDV